MPNSKQIVYLSQAQYEELIANGSITVDGVTVTYDENDIYVTPQAEPVTDVRVNGTSISSGGVANIPIASSLTPGVVRIQAGYGIKLQSDNNSLRINEASDATIKQGIDPDYPIVSKNASTATFYGLAKVAGHDEKDSTESFGTYTSGAKAAIQQMLGISNLLAPSETTTASKAYSIGEVFTSNGKLYKATAAIAAADAIVVQNQGEEVSGHNAEEVKLADYAVRDVQVNGTSILSNGVVNVPKATNVTPGVACFEINDSSNSYGLGFYSGNSNLVVISGAALTHIKNGTNGFKPIVPSHQHESAFYGLAKAAGDTTQSASSNAVGTYTDNAKASIKSMLGIVDGSTGTVSVSGTTPTITAVENTRYVCGEVSTLSFTPAASGTCIVRFTSGSTATVLTLPSTVKFPEWFDATALEADTIYELCITDGIYGAVMSWAL